MTRPFRPGESSSTGEPALAYLLATFTGTSLATALGALDASPPGHRSVAETRARLLEALANRIRQTPAEHGARAAALQLVNAGCAGVSDDALARAVEMLRVLPPAFPKTGQLVTLPALDPVLTDALRTLFDLDDAVPQPWTLIGGLMVLLHCSEHDVASTRPTTDADVVAGVFTHRDALAAVTRRLQSAGFVDVTPDPLAGGALLSYRWRRDAVLVDVAVPPRANEQQKPPVTVNARPSIELPATQQALSRTERVEVALGEEGRGWVRRPDLLGALVVKAQASVSDRRLPQRHMEDLVSLYDAVARSGLLPGYRTQLRTKDRDRLRAAAQAVPASLWRRAQDPEAAQGAQGYLLGGA